MFSRIAFALLRTPKFSCRTLAFAKVISGKPYLGLYSHNTCFKSSKPLLLKPTMSSGLHSERLVKLVLVCLLGSLMAIMLFRSGLLSSIHNFPYLSH